MSHSQHPYPRLRRFALLWLAIYVPAYAWAYGALNFLFLCNVGVIITALALIRGDQLWISSQAVASPLIGLAWALDAGTRLLTGSFLFGGTEYMWDPQFPWFTRMLSLYHLAWPALTLWCVRRRGYDRRGRLLQAAIAGVGIVAARLLTEPEQNVNYAYTAPFFNVQLGPPALHLTITVLFMAVVVYGAVHLFIIRVLGCPAPDPHSRQRVSRPASAP